MMFVSLPQPQLLKIAGRDAIAFAQAQFCNDVSALAVGDWQWNAWLDVQGRVRYFFALLRIEPQSLLLLLRGGDASVLAAELKRFVFRAQVGLSALDGWSAQGLCGDAAIDDFFSERCAPREAQRIYADAQTIALAMPGRQARLLVLRFAHGDDEIARRSAADLESWLAADISAGLVEIDSAQASHYLPQALGFEAIAAINFRKGCYPGQEIMARLHFKGGNKRALYQVEFGAEARIAEGTEIVTLQDPPQSAGFLLNTGKPVGGARVGLASLREDAASTSLALASEPSVQLKVISRF